MAVSPAVRKKCVAEAKKTVAYLHTWGRWIAAFNCICGLALIVLGICFLVLFNRTFLLPELPAAGIALAIQMGAVGMLFGGLVGFLFFQGVYYIAEGVKLAKGDPVSDLILEYDALLRRLHEQSAENTGRTDAESAGK